MLGEAAMHGEAQGFRATGANERPSGRAFLPGQMNDLTEPKSEKALGKVSPEFPAHRNPEK